ncbi:MAG: hypothetical protein R2765_12180 [Ferruginibacter sp.]|nr:hypothetical protein [Bacteroidota bacterium]MBX2918672.1 hypothetical protein [Ferruginibacter sp.]MCB0709149.1 hypothetical protein [Chitinophagaceae bacterium]MCC7378788.1 hypothetical protein [Chitinophagaceae bacterium]
MKRVLLATVLFFLLADGFSQSLSKITIAGRGQVEVFAFALPENVQLYLTKDGNILKWGFDKYIGYQENYNNDLEPYVGRVEYYTQNDDVALRGKVKYIGNILITYYASYENDALKGKLKAIGPTSIDYYLNYDDEACRGYIKKIGSLAINWYASYENADIKGKLKNVGATLLSYYGSFEDKAYRGKIKSIGQYNITYYSSFELYSGSMKTGNTVMNVGGVKYYIKNY